MNDSLDSFPGTHKAGASNLSLSLHGTSVDSGYQSFYHSLLLSLAMLIAALNSYVLYLFTTTYNLRIGLTNRLLANMAWSDLMTSLVTIPVTIASASLSGRTIANVKLMYFASNVLSEFCTVYAVSSVSLIMLNRYLLICRPFCGILAINRIPTIRQLLIKTLVIMLLAALPITWSFDLLLVPDQPIRHQFFIAEKIYALIITVVFFFIPSCLVCVGLVLMRASIKKSLAYEGGFIHYSHRDSVIQYSVVFRYLIAFTAFIICWLPLMTIRTADYFTTDLAKHLSKEMLEAIFTLRCTTSLLNPLIYTWNDKDYKTVISRSYLYRKMALLARFRRQPSESIQLC